MAFNPLDFFSNLLPKDTSLFGGAPSSSVSRLQQLGLLDADAINKAKNQSNMQGLLQLGLGYLAQPKNQGYGSMLPYLAKAAIPAIQQSQKPYDNLLDEANVNQQVQQYTDNESRKLGLENFSSGWGVPNSNTTQTSYTGSGQVPRDIMQNQDNVSPYTNSQLTENAAPQFNTPVTTNTGIFNKDKYFADQLAQKNITLDDYVKYSPVLNPAQTFTSVADGASLVNAVGEEVYNNPKDGSEKSNLTGDMANWYNFNGKLKAAGESPLSYEQFKNTFLGDSASSKSGYNKGLDLMPDIINNAATANAELGLTTDLLDKINNEDYDYFSGAMSDVKLSIAKFADNFGLLSEDYKTAANNTEFINAVSRAGVFKLLKPLGIGARGLDTPAERDFLIAVLTGDATKMRSTFKIMLEQRQETFNGDLRKYNQNLNDGNLDKMKGVLSYRTTPYNLGSGSSTSDFNIIDVR
tara:strand:- start:834 stop:2228 length:1395 start_codon:yes stop_codon:yes gene_type:complete